MHKNGFGTEFAKQVKPCPENGDVPLNVVSEIWETWKGKCPLYGVQFKKYAP